MDDCSEEQLIEELKTKRICRFCLSQEEPLSDILSSTSSEATNSKISKTSTPLTLQIMACVAIEVYKDDGMPCTICDNCRNLMDHSYRFKQICKKADTLLKTYPLTGVWPEKLQVPINLFKSIRTATTSKPQIRKIAVKEKPQQISVSAKSSSNVPVPIPMVENKNCQPSTDEYSAPEINSEPLQIERMEEDVKPKIVKLSIEDLRSIKQGRSITKDNFIQKTSTVSNYEATNHISNKPIEKRSPVKIINGSLETVSKAPIILNSMKPSNRMEEHIVQTSEGTLEIVCIESPQESVSEEVDPMKTAPQVPTNVFPCNECERTFPLRQLLDIHLHNHNRERNHPCDMCDRRFFSKYDLSKHILTHTGERPFVCIICKAAFSRSTLLTRHQKVHKDLPKFLCMYCERTFLSNEDLLKHLEYHQKKRPFQCQKCSKSFAYKQGLERHEVAHETIHPFPCEHCDLTFPSASKLARHLTAHAGSRPYPCRMCSSSFMLSHHLTRHVRSHQGGKGTYKCNECTSIFQNQDELIYHSAEHATKSLTCPLCREHFESLEQVTEHIKEHSEGVQFACDYCDLLFTTEQKLSYHCQQEHLSVLAMDRTETNENSGEEMDQQYIIEEISIQKDGSRTITTFVDGEEKEKKYVPTNSSQTFKSEMVSPEFAKRTNKKYNEQRYEDDHGEDYYEEDFDEDLERQTENIPSKIEKCETLEKSPSKAATKPEPKTPTAVKPEPSALPVSPPKSIQQKLDTFLKKVAPPTTSTVPKSVGDVLKKLPKGMTIKRPTPTSTSSVVEKKAEEESSPVTPHVDVIRTSSTYSKSQSTTVQKKPIPATQPTKQLQPASIVTSTTVKPPIVENTKQRVAIKRPAEESLPHSPVKKQSVEVAKPVGTSSTPSTPSAKPPANTVSKNNSGAKKSKTFEMKIGDRMVKVQKVVMTKAEVAAMARDGKIEMQGDTMILKKNLFKK